MDFLAEWPDSELEDDARSRLTQGMNTVLVMLSYQIKLAERASRGIAFEIKEGEPVRRKKQQKEGK